MLKTKNFSSLYPISACCTNYQKKTKCLLKQSTVRASGLEHPCMQDPLKASQLKFVHLDEHFLVQPWEYLVESQPKVKERKCCVILLNVHFQSDVNNLSYLFALLILKTHFKHYVFIFLYYLFVSFFLGKY